MLTLRGLFKDGQVTLLDNVPFSGEYHVLVTFLDTGDEVVVVPKAEHAEFMRATTKLTTREMEILPLVQKGLTNKDIARVLELGEGTVRNYVSSILGKLDATNRTHAIDRAVELGLIPSSSE